MGASFAVFAGFYYWVEKITGRRYDQLIGAIQFWTLFIGVKRTFARTSLDAGKSKMRYLIRKARPLDLENLIRNKITEIKSVKLSFIKLKVRNGFISLCKALKKQSMLTGYELTRYLGSPEKVFIHFIAKLPVNKLCLFKVVTSLGCNTPEGYAREGATPKCPLQRDNQSIQEGAIVTLKSWLKERKQMEEVTHLMEKDNGLRLSAGVCIRTKEEGSCESEIDCFSNRKLGITAPQRINAKELVYILGLLESDGCIKCYLERGRKGKVYLRGEVTVGLKEEDIKLCYWIRKILGCGTVRKVRHRIDKERKVSRYQLRSKKLIKDLIIKGFEKYPPLTNKKRRSVEWFKICYEKNIYIPKEKIESEKLPKVEKEQLYGDYVKDWVVGFIEGDGSFYVSNKGVVGFNITQKGEEDMMELIRKTMGIKRGLEKGETGIIMLTAESREDLQRVVEFMMNKERVRLKGLKKVKFLVWLRYLRRTDSKRYKGLIIPERYEGILI